MVFHLIQQNLQLPVSVWKIAPIITTKTLSKEYTSTCVYKNKNEVYRDDMPKKYTNKEGRI